MGRKVQHKQKNSVGKPFPKIKNCTSKMLLIVKFNVFDTFLSLILLYMLYIRISDILSLILFFSEVSLLMVLHRLGEGMLISLIVFCASFAFRCVTFNIIYFQFCLVVDY